ncbi:unnamed protein product, partial [Durusdinium trenchii]
KIIRFFLFWGPSKRHRRGTSPWEPRVFGMETEESEVLGSIGGETEDLQAGCRNCDDAERGDKASDAEVHAPAEGPSAQCDGEGVKAQECVRPRVESAQKEFRLPRRSSVAGRTERG